MRVLGRAGLPAPLALAAVAVLAAALAAVAAPRAALCSRARCWPPAWPPGAPHDGALDWLVPAALRAAEYLIVVAVGLVGAVPPPVVYLLLFALALHHYDLTARMEKGAPDSAAGHGAARLGRPGSAAPRARWPGGPCVRRAWCWPGLVVAGLRPARSGTGEASRR